MIKNYTEISEFKAKVEMIEPEINFDNLMSLDLPYLEEYENCVVIMIPDYSVERSKIFLFLSKENTLILSNEPINNYEKKFSKILNKPYGESTIVGFLFLRDLVKRYFKEFEIIRAKMNLLDLSPEHVEIENTGRRLRLLTDRFEALLQILINLQENELKEFNTKLIEFDYELLVSKTKYGLERCRSHIYRISSLRAKAEMIISGDLNKTMKRLTVIMTFLTIVSIVVSVPGTIGAILGIPALSEAYFMNYTGLLVWILIGLTLLSVILGYLYWKSLKMDKRMLN